jgi:hypothetical protein
VLLDRLAALLGVDDLELAALLDELPALLDLARSTPTTRPAGRAPGREVRRCDELAASDLLPDVGEDVVGERGGVDGRSR